MGLSAVKILGSISAARVVCLFVTNIRTFTQIHLKKVKLQSIADAASLGEPGQNEQTCK